MLHFFEDIDAVFKRIHDLLTPDGLFISETACLGKKQTNRQLAAIHGTPGLLPKMNLLTTAQLEQALEKFGFHLVDKIKFSDKPDAEFTLFAKKTSS